MAAFQQAHGRLPSRRGRVRGPAEEEEGQLAEEGEAQLAFWCTSQRYRKEGRYGAALSADECAALEALPGWRWLPRPLVPSWETRLQQVAAFQQQHGRLPAAPRRLADLPLEGQLGYWCRRQSRRRNQWCGKQAPLTERQAALLEAIPGWRWSTAYAPSWHEWAAQLAAFLELHGRLPHDQRTEVEGERALARWAGRQRQRREGRGGERVSPEQEAALEAITGWRWNLQGCVWRQHLERLAAFVAEHGQLPRQVGSKRRALLAGERALGVWGSRQRLRHKGHAAVGGPLTDAQRAALEAIPGWCWGQRLVQGWGEWLQQLAAFQRQHGRLPGDAGSSRQAEGEPELSSWMHRQRQRRKGNKNYGSPLTSEQAVALEGIPGWVWAQRARGRA